MMIRRFSLVAVVLLVSLSGCPQQTGGSINYNGEINATNAGFRLDGEVSNTGLSEATHRNVTVYLYASNGTAFVSEEIGTIDERESLPVTIESRQIPKYVIINSPDFWRHEGDITVDYYEYLNDSQRFTIHSVASKDEFPVPVPPNGTTPSS